MPEVFTSDKNNAGQTNRTGTYVPTHDSHSSSSRSTEKTTTHKDKSQYRTTWTYDERYDFALNVLKLSPEKAHEYASAQYSSVSDAPGEMGIFRKTSSDRRLEKNEAADAELINRLLDEQRYMLENSPEAEVARRQAAGINDALTGGKEIGTGDALGIDDTATSQAADQVAQLNAEVAARPGQVASTLMSSLAGVMNMINSGVDISRTFYNMDIQEGKEIFETIDNMSDLGNFFPFLGISYDPNEDTWYDYETESDTNIKLDTQYVYGLSRGDFMRRIRKRMPHISDRYAGDLYTAYKGMASPKAINSYMQQRLDNIKTQNATVDAQAGGIARTGALTQPSPAFGSTGLSVGSKYLSTYDRETYDTYVSNVADLELLGIRAQKAAKTKSFKADEIEAAILDVCDKLVTQLKHDALVKNSVLANYLLVNMMSGSFNDIGQAAWMTTQPQINSVGDFFDVMKDFGALSFLGASKFAPGLINTDLKRHPRGFFQTVHYRGN